jgi:alpha-mannosidase
MKGLGGVRGVGLLALLLLVGTHWGCAPDSQTENPPLSSRHRVVLPSPYLPGYVADIKGEVLQYHSPVPIIGTSLLVRSENRGQSIAWESAPIPGDFQGEAITLAFMIGIDVNVEPRGFDVRMDGLDLFQIRSPLEAKLGDTLVWEGAGGVRGEFRVTKMDRYGDAMGFLFLTVPQELLEPGQPLEFEVLGESAGARTWFMVFRDTLEPRIELQNAAAVRRTPQGETQILRLDLLTLSEGQPFHLDSPIGSVDTVAPLGHLALTLPVRAVEEPELVQVAYRLGEHEGSFDYSVTPTRRMEIYLLHHTHLDIGYTHHQDEVERIQWESLEEALRLGEASQDYPEGSRFVWNPEGLWPVESYVRAHPGEKSEALMEGIRKGWIELDGMFAGLLTGITNEETLLHSLDAAGVLSEMSGIPIQSEMLSDIPGFSWGLVEALSQNGIRYLSIGPNFGHRIGHFTEELGDLPFWWEGPSGESRVLTWVSGGGYSWFHSGLGYTDITVQLEEEIFQYMDQLLAGDYPYDMTYLRYNIGSDNGPPDPGLADAVRAWNETYASPVLKISGTTGAFRAFEEAYGEGLPVLRGDLTGHWEDGAASSARETAMVRRVAEAIPQTEKLAELNGVELDPDLLWRAWREVLLYFEHTWGSWNSISEPYADLTVTSWERKRDMAEEAVRLAAALREDAMGPARSSSGSAQVEIINTLGWPRTGLVILSAAETDGVGVVKDASGRALTSQRLNTGELAFLAHDVPAEASVWYTLETGEATAGLDVDQESPILTTSEFSVQLDPGTGDLRSIRYLPTGRELVAEGGDGLNQYLYVPGRDPAEVVTSGRTEFAWVDGGPLVWTLRSETEAPGLRGPLLREVRVVEGWDRIHLINTLPKAWVLDPEAVLFRFPFALEEPEIHIDGPFGAYRPEMDQIPGASKNYFSLQRWVDLSDEDGGVTLASIDAPLVQFGEIRTDAIVTGWLEHAEPSPTLFSYVMNNYWETNYRAAQDDEVSFTYALRVHGGFEEEAANRFGLEEARPLITRVVR